MNRSPSPKSRSVKTGRRHVERGTRRSAASGAAMGSSTRRVVHADSLAGSESPGSSWPPGPAPGCAAHPVRPKALCPVGDVALVDLALDRVDRSPPTSPSTSTTAGRRWRRTSAGRRARPRVEEAASRSAPPARSATCGRGSTAGPSLVVNGDTWSDAAAGRAARRLGRRAVPAARGRASGAVRPADAASPAPLLPVGRRSPASSRSRRASGRCLWRAEARGRALDGVAVPAARSSTAGRRRRTSPPTSPPPAARSVVGPAPMVDGHRSSVRGVAGLPRWRPASACVDAIRDAERPHRPGALTGPRTRRQRDGRASWSARSWPQAASISTPRVRRTVALTPSSASRSRNARTRPVGVPRTG